ncbi:MAG: hypothetical protein HOG03_16450 [Desulfobacula sp.]|jgi:hypothetical protein|uniref:hypothetical protein n=1 Tax=Desulfobacula sp. TaxID=2593537 RepID=UPI001D6FEEF2|nr:hypothetical protein [Desulfobacula sp.]MBT3484321.1 hypothetical protein [Desulfobacula sp.]MBT3806170.1 hypothetical protein [Desulfobacula sp.]MBT4024130.1 hypothetical protein [Desulfobacula sp.]MBT4197454.1 hypothetical protein [Desulfobacula sp.]
MKIIFKPIITILLISFFFIVNSFAQDTTMISMENQHGAESDKIGDLINESVVDGYFLSTYFLDLRTQDTGGSAQNDKPHHIMVYITDKNHTPVIKGKVGFLIKDSQGKTQKSMGMIMNDGFGTTADMKKKGIYKIMTKTVLADKKFMNSFDYEIR